MDNDRHEPRHGVSMQGRFRSGKGIARDVVVTDLSTSGCKFVDRFCNLRVGAYVSLRIGNIGPLTAEVRWVEKFTVGVQFESAIHPSVMEHMLTTIDGWKPVAALSDNINENDHPDAKRSGTDEPPRFLMRVRAATIDDVREVFAHTSLDLPIKEYDDLVEMFHRMLEIVAIEDSLSDGSDQ